VKFSTAARVLAAPRQVSASAFQAREPANKIAAAAARVTVSLRIAFLFAFQ
jgi:hypothetical protein